MLTVDRAQPRAGHNRQQSQRSANNKVTTDNISRKARRGTASLADLFHAARARATCKPAAAKGLGRTSLSAVGAEAIVTRLYQTVKALLQSLVRHDDLSWCLKKDKQTASYGGGVCRHMRDQQATHRPFSRMPPRPAYSCCTFPTSLRKYEKKSRKEQKFAVKENKTDDVARWTYALVGTAEQKHQQQQQQHTMKNI